MKKGYKILALFLLGLFAISIIAGVVSAATIGDQVKGFFTSASGGISDVAKGEISRILLMALIFMIVYSIFSFIPLVPQKSWAHYGLSAIVAILSFIFVSPTDIAYILSTYEGLGIALTTVIPLIIIIVFTLELDKSDFRYSWLINKIVIFVFTVYVAVRYISITWGVDLALRESSLVYLYPATILFLIIWYFMHKRVSYWMFKEEIKSGREIAEGEHLSEVTAELERIAQQINAAVTDAQKNALAQKYNRLIKRQNELGGNYKPLGS